jgi:hypothetical protein
MDKWFVLWLNPNTNAIVVIGVHEHYPDAVRDYDLSRKGGGWYYLTRVLEQQWGNQS